MQCQALGSIFADRVWNTSDIVFLGVELCVLFALSACIVRKRNEMSNKDRLIEHAATIIMATAGLKKIHFAGFTIFVLVVVVCLAGAKLVSATLTLTGFACLCLLGYYVKITLFSSRSFSRHSRRSLPKRTPAIPESTTPSTTGWSAAGSTISTLSSSSCSTPSTSTPSRSSMISSI